MPNNKIMTPAEFYCSKGYIDKSDSMNFETEAFIPMPSHVTEYAEYYHREMSKPPKDVEEAIELEGKKRTECHNFNQAEAGYNAKWFRRGGRYGFSLAVIYIQEAYKDGYLKHVSGSRRNLGSALQALAEEYTRQKYQQKGKEEKE